MTIPTQTHYQQLTLRIREDSYHHIFILNNPFPAPPTSWEKNYVQTIHYTSTVGPIIINEPNTLLLV